MAGNRGLGEALYREMTGRSPRTEVNTVGGAVEHFMARAGGVAARAARLAGVPASTFRGWVRGRQPKEPGELVDRAARSDRRARLSAGRERRLRDASPEGWTMIATYEYDGRSRGMDIGRYLDATLPDDLVDAYLAGADLDELGEIFTLGVDDSHGNGFYTQTFNNGAWSVASLAGWA